MILPKAEATIFKQKHMGINLREFQDSLSDLGDRLFRLRNDVVQSSRIGMQQRFTEQTMTLALDKAKETLELSKKDVEKLQDLIITTYNYSTWGLSNALTELAQLHTLERRLDIEKYAGKLLFNVRD